MVSTIGGQERHQDRFDAMGSNLLFVRPGSANMAGVRTGFGGRSNLKIADVGAIERECPSVKAVSRTSTPRPSSFT
jgi:hypothetical protein